MKGCRRELKWTLAVMLCACMAIWPAVFAEDGTEHLHETALTADTVTIGEAGAYYLAEDVCLQQTLKISGDGIEVKLCLNGHSLTVASGTYVIEVGSGASLSILDCYTPETHGTLAHEYWYSYYEPTIISNPAGGYWKDTAEGGCILGYTSAGNTHQCINVNGGSVTMYGGTVAGGKSGARGGGVYVKEGGSFTMYGGAVKHNYATSTGGGICVYSGSVAICGGHVDANTAIQAGGGVYLMPNCSLYMESGSIDGNIQGKDSSMTGYGGGGVYLTVLTACNMTGGSISGNTSNTGGGGVMMVPLAELRLSGDVKISGNMKGEQADNVSLYYKQNNKPGSVVLSGALGTNAAIGLNYTKETLDDPVTVVTADSEYCSEVSATDFSHFSSDDSTRSLLLQDGVIQLMTGRVHAICGATCTHEAAHEQAVFLPMDEAFTGGALASGSYYLTKDIVLTEPILIAGEGTVVNLCLEGRELKNTSGYVIKVTEGAKLNLCDCYDAATHPGEEYAHSSTNPYIRATTSFYGGALNGNTGHTAACGGVSVDGGTFRMYGGVIGGASQNGGVNVMNSGTFELYGGSVIQCYKKGNGGGVCADESSTLRLYGGTVADNYAGQYGGGVCAEGGFEIEGEVYITGNAARTFTTTSNVYVPMGRYLTVTGTVTGEVGITMERDGLFTTGGGAESRSAFKADAPNGVYVEAVDGELAIEEYGVAVQPTEKSVTVTMKSPEHVASYQWYVTEPGEAETLTGAVTGGYWDVSSFTLQSGDTLRVTDLPDGAAGVSLMRLVENADGDSVPETAVSDYEPEDGAYCVAAPEDGKYILRVIFTAAEPDGAAVSVTVQSFELGVAVEGQALPSYTGKVGWRLCKATYDDNVTVIYSDPVWAADHRHEGSTDIYTPLSGDGSGGLRIGDGSAGASTELQSGKYFLPANLTLDKPLTVTSGTVELCLNGHTLQAGNGAALIVSAGASLILCDCTGGGMAAGISAAGDITLSGEAGVIGTGIYLADGAILTPAEDFSAASAIDISMKNGGAFTAAGCAKWAEYFCPGEAGWFLSEDGDGRLCLDRYDIITQPTASLPAVAVNCETGAAYQWYKVTTETVADESDIRYDAKTKLWTPDEKGECFTLSLTEGQTIIITPQNGLNAAVLWNGVALEAENGVFTVYISQEGTYTLSLVLPEDNGNAPQLSAEVYTVGGAVDGAADALLSTGEGTYICRASWPDGTVLWSDFVTIQSKSSSSSSSSSAAESKTPAEEQTWPVFTDVSEGAWYEKYVRFVYEAGLMEGTGGALFSPNAGLTRGMAATLLWRMAGNPAAGQEAPFDDVEGDRYYYEAVCWARLAGVILGVDNLNFAPDEPVTREQFAVMLYRYAGCPEIYGSLLLAFTDSDMVSGYAVHALVWAVRQGIMCGRGNDILDPISSATRAEVAAMLQRYLEN